MNEIQQMKKALKKKTPKKGYSSQDYLSTGSTLLNLACSGKSEGGLVKGLYYYFVGDSQSGKTWLCLTAFAEAARNPNFDGYRFIYDNGEGRSDLINIEQCFGRKVLDRLEPPSGSIDDPKCSETVEEFYFNVDDACTIAVEENRPFIYILDSQDSLTSESEISKFDEQKKAHEKGKETAGSYGDGKAKKHSSFLRAVVGKVKKTKSILIVIGQTRDNIGIGYETKTRSGGRALTFYAGLEVWTAVKKTISKDIRGKKRKIGFIAGCRVKKNSINGWAGEVDVPIYSRSVGVDDVGSCVDFLVLEKHWKKSKVSIVAHDLEEESVVMTREKLIQFIEQNSLERQLQLIVEDVWAEIEEESKIKRKRRYE